MASYFTAVMVAVAAVVGLHVSIEGNENIFFCQDRLGDHTTAQLLELAKDSKSEDHLEAILQLGFRPGDLSVTVPALAKISAMGEVQITRQAAGMALKEIGSPAAEHLQALFDSDQRLDTVFACSAIHSIGPSCAVYLPQIRKCLLSSQPMMRRSGLFALQGLDDKAIAAIDELIICIENDPDFNNQCSACRVIEKLGPKASKAQASLLVLLEKGNPSTRGWAAVCLGAIGQTDSDVDVAKLLSDKLVERRFPAEIQRILLGIAKLGPDGAIAADNIRKWSTNWDNYVKTHCAYALWRITGETEEALEIFGAVLDVPGHQDDALEMMTRMGPDCLPLLNKVKRFLKSHEPNTRELALVTIGNMGNEAKAAVPSIKQLLNDPDALVRVTAQRTLADLK